MVPMWKSLFLGLLAMGGAVTPVLVNGIQKPDRIEVSSMIQKEAPLSVEPILAEIRRAQVEIRIHQAKIDGAIGQILEVIKK